MRWSISRTPLHDSTTSGYRWKRLSASSTTHTPSPESVTARRHSWSSTRWIASLQR